ncbi:tectonic-2 [Coturnix japonica]|uniref:tectonic-2 n=1 Tax=Coturnix japonica TaxID=93934 RepID=UPI00077803EB|nr:tectonic-2 [Coturnix japonica]
MAALSDAMAAAGLGALLLAALCAGQPVFQPSFIHMSGLRVNSFFLGDSSGVTFSIILDAIDKETGNLLLPNCGGNERAGDWELSVTAGVGSSKVTVTFTRNLQLCLPNATDCCTAPLCVVETVQVLACSGSAMLARLIIQAEIYANSSFMGNVSEIMSVIPNQVFQPLGSCPCDLTDGACDVRCCCDPECTPDLKQLFNGSCFTGVFGGDVNPPFDQLCSTQTTEYTPDWFPFLCIQSSLSNTPFLGYFYDGSVSAPRSSAPRVRPFRIPVQASPGKVFTGYRAGDPIMTEDDEYFTIPQPSLAGQCAGNAPVAFLQDFDVRCLSDAASYKEGLSHDVKINSGTGDFIQQNVTYKTVTDRDKFITKSEFPPTVGIPLQSITFAEHYTFVCEGDNIEGVNVTVFQGNLYGGEMLTQRFTAEFVRLKSDNAAEVPNNPGYQVGNAVRAANVNASDTAGSLSIWQPADRSLCTSATHTPVLFGVDSFSGCLLEVDVNEDCSHLRENVIEKLNSLIQATHVGKRRNSNDSNPKDWVQIIRLEPSNLNISGSPGDLKGICPDVPANLNIRIIFAAVGAVWGVPREEILAVQTSYSTVTWQFQCGLPCANPGSLLPITAAVEFIRVPAQPPVPMSRFQMNYTEFDCARNDICWPQLLYPLTRFYTGEPYSQCLAAGLALAFLAVLAAVLGSPCFAQAWENFSL